MTAPTPVYIVGRAWSFVLERTIVVDNCLRSQGGKLFS